MAIRVLFVPFVLTGSSERPGGSYADKNNAWIDDYSQKQAVKEGSDVNDIYQCWYAPGRRSSMIAGLRADDQLYIRGHSLAGLPGIFDHSSHDEQGRKIHPVKMDSFLLLKLNESNTSGTKNLAYMLKASQVFDRLQESGLQPEFAGTIKCYNCHSAEGDPNFATALAEELTANGYRDCTIWGYKGALSSMYDSSIGHKSSTNEPNQRAMDARVLIRGPLA